MILRLVHPGSAARGPLDEAAADYRERISRRAKAQEAFVRPVKLADESAGSVAAALSEEADRILKKVGPRDLLIALDKGGEPWTSEQLAKRLQGWMNRGVRAVVFALGSAHGLDERVIRAAEKSWSFGALTLPHDLARVVLWEQLYRAHTILAGEPYHK